MFKLQSSTMINSRSCTSRTRNSVFGCCTWSLSACNAAASFFGLQCRPPDPYERDAHARVLGADVLFATPRGAFAGGRHDCRRRARVTTSILRFITRRFDLLLLPGLKARAEAMAGAGSGTLGDLTGALDLSSR